MVLYHYVLGNFYCHDGSPILSRYVAIALVLSSVAILLNSSVSHRLPVQWHSVFGLAKLLVRAVFTIFRSVPSQSNRLLLFSAVLYVLQRAIQAVLTIIQLIL